MIQPSPSSSVEKSERKVVKAKSNSPDAASNRPVPPTISADPQPSRPSPNGQSSQQHGATHYGAPMDLRSPRLSVPIYILTALLTFVISYWITDLGLVLSVIVAAVLTGITVWGRQRALQR